MTRNHEVTLRDGTATITGAFPGEPFDYLREYERWDKIPLAKRTMLETAVKTAPLMVGAAIDALEDYCDRCDQRGTDDVAVANEEAWIGLAKYFCLTGADTATYWEEEKYSGVSPIRATFGFQDEWGHSPYKEWKNRIGNHLFNQTKQKLTLGMPKEGANGVRSGTGPVQDEQWLENADSYAWFARRMWKRARNGR
jgi:hypothetical protein